MKARHLVVLAGTAAYFAGGIAWLGGRTARSEAVFAAGSVYERADDGLSLGFEYLRGRGRQVATLLDEIHPARVPGNAVVFRLRPLARPETAGRDGAPVPRVLITAGEHDWLARGGRLVLGLDKPYGPLDVGKPGGAPPAAKVFPIWPGVRSVKPVWPRRLGSGLPASAVTLLAVGEHPLAARWRVGQGEVIALACPEVFENAHLAEADHLSLLEALAATGRPVLFDEAAHGLEHPPGLMSLLLEWRLGPALVIAAGALLLALWRSRARLGPEEDEHEEMRSDAVDLVDSLALLYRRAIGGGQLLALYHDALRRRASVRTGLKGDALEARLHDLTDGVTAPSAAALPTRAEFDRVLQALNRAFDKMEDHAHTR